MSQSEVKETSKWDYIRRISEYGAANNMDAVLKLLENVVLPDTITTIEDRAFYVCTKLKTITLPNSVTSWGEFIFYGSALETVTFREGLQMIGENAFRGADQLKTVNLPSTLTEIKDRAFYVTEDLEEITLPASLKKMVDCIMKLDT